MAFNKTIGRSLNFGFPGTPSRGIDEIISEFVYKGEKDLFFGVPVVQDGNKEGIVAFGAGHKAEDFIGMTVINVKSNQTFGKEDYSYKTNESTDVLVRGTMTVAIVGGVPVIRGKVYALPDGTLTADSATEGAVELPNVVFAKAGKDNNNVAEITILERRV